MSATLKRVLLLALALVLSFSLVAFVGCKSLPQEEMDRIIAGALTASYDTVSFEMELPMTVEVTGGSDPGTMTADTGGTGAIDIANEAMWMNMSIDVSVPGVGSQSISAEIYILEGWMYSGMEIPDLGEQWVKMELTEEMWQQQDEVGRYVELLATAIEVDYKGTGTANGVECYVFEIEPDMDTLNALMLQETSGMGVVDLSGVNLSDLYKKITVKEWLAKDDYRLQRAEIEIVMEMRPADVGATSDDFDKMTMEIDLTMRFFDYNQPVSVVLPPEALDAEEIPLEY
jgi:hypothetical protein